MANPIEEALKRMLRNHAASRRRENPELATARRAQHAAFVRRAGRTLSRFNQKPRPVAPLATRVAALSRSMSGRKDTFVPSVRLNPSMLTDRRSSTGLRGNPELKNLRRRR